MKTRRCWHLESSIALHEESRGEHRARLGVLLVTGAENNLEEIRSFCRPTSPLRGSLRVLFSRTLPSMRVSLASSSHGTQCLISWAIAGFVSTLPRVEPEPREVEADVRTEVSVHSVGSIRPVRFQDFREGLLVVQQV